MPDTEITAAPGQAAPDRRTDMPDTEITAAPDQAAPDRRTEIATIYAGMLRDKHPERHDGLPRDMHLNFADAVIARDAYGLKHLSNGLNEVGKAAFTKVTGIKLPKTQGMTWLALREWGGVSDKLAAHIAALRKVETEVKFCPVGNVAEVREWIAKLIADGYTTLKNSNNRWWLLNATGHGYDLSKQGSHYTKVRPLIVAELTLAKATRELEEERAAQVDGNAAGDADGAIEHERPRG